MLTHSDQTPNTSVIWVHTVKFDVFVFGSLLLCNYNHSYIYIETLKVAAVIMLFSVIYIYIYIFVNKVIIQILFLFVLSNFVALRQSLQNITSPPAVAKYQKLTCSFLQNIVINISCCHFF